MPRLPFRLYRDRKPRLSQSLFPSTPLADTAVRSRHSMTRDKLWPRKKSRHILYATTIPGQTLLSTPPTLKRANSPASNTEPTLKAVSR